jgi:hypothetical protein
LEKLDRIDRDKEPPIDRIASILYTADYILSCNITGYNGIDRTHWWIYHTHDRVVNEQDYDDDY